MEKFTMVGNLAIHYTDSEKGDKAIVLIHGYLESLEVWDGFSTLLQKNGFRVITLDLPGHGISEVVGETHSMDFLANAVIGLTDKIGVSHPVILGHSMGGYVALACVKNAPDKIAGLILFSSTPNPDTPEKRENRKREIELIRAGKKELLANTNSKKGFAAENRKRLAEEISDLALQVMLTEDEGIIAVLNGMMEREDMNPMLRETKVPQLFIFGKKDEYIPVDIARSVADNNPQAKIEWLDGSGHNGFMEEPERSAEIITAFVNSIK